MTTLSPSTTPSSPAVSANSSVTSTGGPMNPDFSGIPTALLSYLAALTMRIEKLEEQNQTVKNRNQTSDKVRPAIRMMMNMGFVPGLGLGKYLQGLTREVEAIDHRGQHGLGYILTPEDKAETKRVERLKRMKLPYKKPDLIPYRLSLNSYFVKKGEELPCMEFSEPWFDHTGKLHLQGYNIDPRTLVTPVTRELKNGCTLGGPIATKKYMVEELGLVPPSC